MTPLTAEKIAELERLLAAATAGPWVTDDALPGRVYSDDATGSIIAQFDGFMYSPRADGEMSANTHLAAAAVNALPQLLSLAKRVAGAPVGERTHEESWLSMKDQYSEVARALGFEGDAWFNDPFASHDEVVARASRLRTTADMVQAAPVETLYHLGGGHLAAELVLPEVWEALDGKRVALVEIVGGEG